MKRIFYTTIKALEEVIHLDEPLVIEKLLKDSDVKDHLADKLFTYNNRGGNKITALMDFYLSLDSEHQMMFDTSMNAIIDEVNSKTVQY